jgi:thymidine kinase
MCSGKTEELIRIVGRLIRSGKTRIQTFKPAIDNRILASHMEIDPMKHITSRTGSYIGCIATDNLEFIREYVYQKDIEVVAFDEAHFFEKVSFLNLINDLLKDGKKLIIGGLDLNFRSEPFGAMGDLLALADNVVKLSAICTQCGVDTYCISQRLINGQPAHYHDPLVVVGDQQYEPRCRRCHVIKKI